jgi:hypothetical protein
VRDLPATAAVLWQDADLFASQAWWAAVETAALPAGGRAEYWLIRFGDRPAALFPMLRSGRRVTALTTPYTCRYAPLLAPDLTAPERSAVFRCFAAACRASGMVRLDALPVEWPWLDALAAGARSAGLVPLRFEHFGNWHESVPATWTAYLAARPGALRETIRRRLRRAERMPQVRLDVVTGAEGLDAGIAAFESVYARSWKQPEPFPAFNAEQIRAAAGQGWLRLGIWRVADQPVAVQVWVVQGRAAAVLKLAHDEAFRTLSPGTVLTALMLRRLIEIDGVRTIDFGRGDDPYKRGWAVERRPRIGLLLVAPWRLDGLLALARHALGRLRARLRPAAGSAEPDAGAGA